MKGKGRKVLLMLWMAFWLTGCTGAEEDFARRAGEPLTGGLAQERNFRGIAYRDGEQSQEEGELQAEDGDQSPEKGEPSEKELQAYLENMSLEEKVAQLFIVLPEALTGVEHVTAAGSATEEAFDKTPVGGVIYMEEHLRSREQVKKMLGNMQAYSLARIGLPAFLCVDEEGGTVARVGGSGRFDVPVIGDMADIGREGSRETAYEAGLQIGGYLSELGFNVDFAPVADVWSNPENTVVQRRSFGSDPQRTAELALAVSQGLARQGVLSSYKHFPGHGATAGDTHAGYAYTDKTLEELRECELIPFQDGADRQVPMIMVGHISLPQVTGDDTPASLSYQIITGLLREEMGYEGLVITDALNMGAIVNQYSSEEAAVKTLQAGADLILMPKDFRGAYEGVLGALEDGTLSRERIDSSVERILRVKLRMN